MDELQRRRRRLKDDLGELWRALSAKDAACVDRVCRTGRIPHNVMDKGSGPNVRNALTPLTHAIYKGCSLSILDKLIQNGARVDTLDPRWKQTPLAMAVKEDRPDVVEHLLHRHGADPNVTMTGL